MEQKVISDELALRIEEDIRRIWNKPEDLVGNFEKQRFKEYCDRWGNGGSIDVLWQEIDRIYFPIFCCSDISSKLDKIIDGGQFEAYVRILNDCKIPFFINEILYYKMMGDDDNHFLIKVLEMAPICVSNSFNSREDDKNRRVYSFENYIDSYLAPVALNLLADNIFRGYRERKAEFDKIDWGKENPEKTDYLGELMTDVSESWNQIRDLVEKREDGLFLSYHYVGKLLSTYGNNEYIDKVADIISCNNKYKQLINTGIWKQKYIIDTQEIDFAFTGILEKPKADVLLEYRTLLRFLPDDTEEEAYSLWLDVFSYDAQSFHTSGITRDLKHYEIAEIIYLQDDVAKSWKGIRNNLTGAYHRIGGDYYQDGSLSIRSHIEFLWNVNICLLAYLGENDEIVEAKNLWGLMWMDALQYVRRYSHYMDSTPYQYVAALITSYFCMFVRVHDEDDVGAGEVDVSDESREEGYLNQLLPLFKEIDDMPILVVQSLDMLCLNQLDIKIVLGDEDYFLPLIRRANKLAFRRKEYEWVGKWCKEKQIKL